MAFVKQCVFHADSRWIQMLDEEQIKDFVSLCMEQYLRTEMSEDQLSDIGISLHDEQFHAFPVLNDHMYHAFGEVKKKEGQEDKFILTNLKIEVLAAKSKNEIVREKEEKQKEVKNETEIKDPNLYLSKILNFYTSRTCPKVYFVDNANVASKMECHIYLDHGQYHVKKADEDPVDFRNDLSAFCFAIGIKKEFCISLDQYPMEYHLNHIKDLPQDQIDMFVSMNIPSIRQRFKEETNKPSIFSKLVHGSTSM